MNNIILDAMTRFLKGVYVELDDKPCTCKETCAWHCTGECGCEACKERYGNQRDPDKVQEQIQQDHGRRIKMTIAEEVCNYAESHDINVVRIPKKFKKNSNGLREFLEERKISEPSIKIILNEIKK